MPIKSEIVPFDPDLVFLSFYINILKSGMKIRDESAKNMV